MTQQPDGVVREVQEATQRAARKLMRNVRASLDVLANDEHDYRSILTEEAWLAGQRFQKDGQQGEPTRYSCKSVWNAHATLQKFRRSQERLSPIIALQVPLEHVEVDSEVDLEASRHARECLEYLKENLSPSDWELLERVALNGGSTTEAYESGIDGLGNTFYRRVARLREKARALLPSLGE